MLVHSLYEFVLVYRKKIIKSDQTTIRIDEIWLFLASSTQRIHGAPDARSQKIAKSKDERIVEC